MGQHTLVGFKGAHKTAAQKRFNRQMSALRISVEHGFARLHQLWTFTLFFLLQKTLLSPVGA
jgi:hypothetical protein